MKKKTGSWYKIYADHGPGHQSHTTYYKWFDEPLTKDDRQFEFDDHFKETHWPIGYVKKIKRLPSNIRESKIEDWTEKLQKAEKMLKILSEAA